MVKLSDVLLPVRARISENSWETLKRGNNFPSYEVMEFNNL